MRKAPLPRREFSAERRPCVSALPPCRDGSAPVAPLPARFIPWANVHRRGGAEARCSRCAAEMANVGKSTARAAEEANVGKSTARAAEEANVGKSTVRTGVRIPKHRATTGEGLCKQQRKPPLPPARQYIIAPARRDVKQGIAKSASNLRRCNGLRGMMGIVDSALRDGIPVQCVERAVSHHVRKKMARASSRWYIGKAQFEWVAAQNWLQHFAL